MTKSFHTMCKLGCNPSKCYFYFIRRLFLDSRNYIHMGKYTSFQEKKVAFLVIGPEDNAFNCIWIIRASKKINIYEMLYSYFNQSSFEISYMYANKSVYIVKFLHYHQIIIVRQAKLKFSYDINSQYKRVLNDLCESFEYAS